MPGMSRLETLVAALVVAAATIGGAYAGHRVKEADIAENQARIEAALSYGPTDQVSREEINAETHDNELYKGNPSAEIIGGLVGLWLGAGTFYLLRSGP